MAEEIIMRGNFTAAQGYANKKLSFTGLKPGFAYNLIEFQLYPSTSIGAQSAEMAGCISCGGNNIDAANIDFNLDEIIATCAFWANGSVPNNPTNYSVINDLFIITQDLNINTFDSQATNVNWQVKFKEVKLSASAEAVANINQYAIYNTELQP